MTPKDKPKEIQLKPKKKSRKPTKKELEELTAKLEETEKKADRYLTQLKYAKADLENIQRQNQRRLQDVTERANGQLLENLLPLLDELGILAGSEAEAEKIREGVGMVKKKLAKLLESEGVYPIQAAGVQFDPYKHEAILEVESMEEPEGYVLEEIRPGYTFKDKVLRASVVKVARRPEEKDEE